MNEIAQALTPHEWLAWTWRTVVWGAVAYLFVLGLLAVIRPGIVQRFFDGFVRSRRINFLEAALRLTVGLAFMAVSRDMKLQVVFFWFGAVLAATAILMMFLYELHKRHAVWAIPFAKRILPLMGVSAIAFGALIVWAMG